MKVLDSRVLLKINSKGLVEKINGFEVPVGSGEYEVADVVSVGPKAENIVPGDKVYIYPGSGKQFTKDGEKYRVVSSSEIIVVL